MLIKKKVPLFMEINHGINVKKIKIRFWAGATDMFYDKCARYSIFIVKLMLKTIF